MPDKELVDRYRSSAERFSMAMLAQLCFNAHKGVWDEANIRQLIRHLKEEVAELEAAVEKGSPPREVLMEAADVGNMAMMVTEAYSPPPQAAGPRGPTGKDK